MRASAYTIPNRLTGATRMFYEKPNPYFMAYPFGDTWEQEQRQEREARLMKSFYPKTTSRVQDAVERECDRMEYEGSMMYDEYPDKFMMEQICKRIEEEVMDSEIDMQEKRNPWLSDLVRVMFFNEMYRRRCRHQRCRRYF